MINQNHWYHPSLAQLDISKIVQGADALRRATRESAAAAERQPSGRHWLTQIMIWLEKHNKPSSTYHLEIMQREGKSLFFSFSQSALRKVLWIFKSFDRETRSCKGLVVLRSQGCIVKRSSSRWTYFGLAEARSFNRYTTLPPLALRSLLPTCCWTARILGPSIEVINNSTSLQTQKLQNLSNSLSINIRTSQATVVCSLNIMKFTPEVFEQLLVLTCSASRRLLTSTKLAHSKR